MCIAPRPSLDQLFEYYMKKGIKLIPFNSKFQNQRKSLAPGLTGGASIFDRPGIGSMAFRNSVSASLFSFNNNNNEANKDNSIGSAGSLAAEEEDIDGKVILGLEFQIYPFFLSFFWKGLFFHMYCPCCILFRKRQASTLSRRSCLPWQP